MLFCCLVDLIVFRIELFCGFEIGVDIMRILEGGSEGIEIMLMLGIVFWWIFLVGFIGVCCVVWLFCNVFFWF